jgi:hypothetical protein
MSGCCEFVRHRSALECEGGGFDENVIAEDTVGLK